MAIKLFIRQPFTETTERESSVIQGVLNVVQSLNGKPYNLDFLTGVKAQNRYTFRSQFQEQNGFAFTPQSFRSKRLKLIEEADVMMIVRTSLSESGAFEVAYNIFGGKKAPIFFAIWKAAPIKTTLLRELDDLVQVNYITFDNPEDIALPFVDFISKFEKG
jgi:carbamoyl-phosphate synthase large subunit